MEFFEVIQKRYSVRSYKSDPVEQSKLDQVLEAARLAPTAANRQPFQILVLRPAGREAELKRIYSREFFVQAPVIICICSEQSRAWSRMDGKNYCDVDVAIAMDHLILAATALGLGTCWIAAFDPAAARQVLGLPTSMEPIAFTPIGYPNSSPNPRKRKPITDLVKF